MKRKPPDFLDIVWCRFPLRENPTQPGPKERPVLILGIAEEGSLLAAAYGTSQAHEQLAAWQLAVLTAPRTNTVFDLTRVARLPYTTGYFPLKPRLMVLPANLHQDLAKAVAAAKAQR